MEGVVHRNEAHAAQEETKPQLFILAYLLVEHVVHQDPKRVVGMVRRIPGGSSRPRGDTSMGFKGFDSRCMRAYGN